MAFVFLLPLYQSYNGEAERGKQLPKVVVPECELRLRQDFFFFNKMEPTTKGLEPSIFWSEVRRLIH